VEEVTLLLNQLPTHTHGPLRANSQTAVEALPGGRVTAQTDTALYVDDTPVAGFNDASITRVGGSRSHSNVMPFLCVHFIVSLFGIYPSRH
jgi:microcystin-dependent protein